LSSASLNAVWHVPLPAVIGWSHPAQGRRQERQRPLEGSVLPRKISRGTLGGSSIVVALLNFTASQHARDRVRSPSPYERNLRIAGPAVIPIVELIVDGLREQTRSAAKDHPPLPLPLR
jgi:hypothetical protein